MHFTKSEHLRNFLHRVCPQVQSTEHWRLVSNTWHSPNTYFLSPKREGQRIKGQFFKVSLKTNPSAFYYFSQVVLSSKMYPCLHTQKSPNVRASDIFCILCVGMCVYIYVCVYVYQYEIWNSHTKQRIWLSFIISKIKLPISIKVSKIPRDRLQILSLISNIFKRIN